MPSSASFQNVKASQLQRYLQSLLKEPCEEGAIIGKVEEVTSLEVGEVVNFQCSDESCFTVKKKKEESAGCFGFGVAEATFSIKEVASLPQHVATTAVALGPSRSSQPLGQIEILPAGFPPSITTTKKRAHVQENNLEKFLFDLLEDLIPAASRSQVYWSLCSSKQCGFEHFIYVPFDGKAQVISGMLTAQWVEGEKGMVWDIVFIAMDKVKMSCHYTPEQVQEHLRSMAQSHHQQAAKISVMPLTF